MEGDAGAAPQPPAAPPSAPLAAPLPALPRDLPDDPVAARLTVYGAMEHLQAVPDYDRNRVRLERWADQARAAGRPEIRVQVLHGLLVNDLFAGVPHARLRARADAFRDAADETGDEIFVARALGGRLTFLGVSDPDALEDRPGDLARAVAMLDEVFETDPSTLGSRAAELSASYNECAQSYHHLELWELEAEMYDKALASFDLVPADDPLMALMHIAVRALTVNRADSVAATVCAFLGAGREDAARDLARSAPRPSPQALAGLPTNWSRSLDAVVRLLDTVAAGPQDAQRFRGVPQDLWDALGEAAWQGYRGLLLLSAAVAAHAAGDDAEAAALAERAAPHFDIYRPSFKNLAFRLAALRRDAADSPALRWAVHQADLRHDARLQVLAAARARLSSERVVRYSERLRRQAFVDELTGVANRHAFNEYLERLRAAPAEQRVCVALVDLDGFKGVNDRFGHGIGDDVLRAVGRLLSAAVRGADLAVRLGGDEFALLLPAVGGARYERRLAGLVDRVGRQEWERLAAGLRVTVSVGSAVGPARDVDALLRSADENLYRAKALGRNRLVG